MATIARRLAANVPGDFYVDESCIDCGACMWIAPKTFDEKDERSFVHRQPQTREEQDLAELALVACPTSSIGTATHRDLARAAAAFPRRFAEAGTTAYRGATAALRIARPTCRGQAAARPGWHRSRAASNGHARSSRACPGSRSASTAALHADRSMSNEAPRPAHGSGSFVVAALRVLRGSA
jgi:ferredoxin